MFFFLSSLLPLPSTLSLEIDGKNILRWVLTIITKFLMTSGILYTNLTLYLFEIPNLFLSISQNWLSNSISLPLVIALYGCYIIWKLAWLVQTRISTSWIRKSPRDSKMSFFIQHHFRIKLVCGFSQGPHVRKERILPQSLQFSSQNNTPKRYWGESQLSSQSDNLWPNKIEKKINKMLPAPRPKNKRSVICAAWEDER